MKKNFKLSLLFFGVFSICVSGFVGIGYFYLNSKIGKAVKNSTPSVPYYSEAPESVGIMFDICNDKTFFFLDFYDKRISAIYNAGELQRENIIMGYSIDYCITGDYDLLAGIIDNVGGIELDYGDEELRYTGVQVKDILSKTVDNSDIMREIVEKTIEKIALNGFSKADLLYIIENSETDLTMPICYFWTDYMKELCGSFNEVN